MWLASHVPGGGLLRDGSRFLALLAPLAACLFGLGVSALAGLVRTHAGPARGRDERGPRSRSRCCPTSGLALGGPAASGPVPRASTPTPGRRSTTDSTSGASGDLLLLPFNSYRVPTWNDGRRSLDPLGRFMTPNYLASDTLVVSGVTVAGEDERARRVAELLEKGAAPEELARQLREEGIAWVLLDKEAQAWSAGVGTHGQARRVPRRPRGERLVVWELPGAVSTDSRPVGRGRGLVRLAGGRRGGARLCAASLLARRARAASGSAIARS